MALITICNVSKTDKLQTSYVDTERVDTSVRKLVGGRGIYGCASNMGSPAYYNTGTNLSVRLYDWYTSKHVSEVISFADRPHGYDICNFRVNSAAVVANTALVIGNSYSGQTTLLTPSSQIHMYDLRYPETIHVDKTGQRLYMCNRTQLGAFMQYGEELPFAWWLPDKYDPGRFAAYENMAAVQHDLSEIHLWDTRTNDYIHVTKQAEYPIISNFTTRYTFTCDYLLTECVESAWHHNRRSEYDIKLCMYDLRNIGVVYQADVADYEVLPVQCMAFCESAHYLNSYPRLLTYHRCSDHDDTLQRR